MYIRANKYINQIYDENTVLSRHNHNIESVNLHEFIFTSVPGALRALMRYVMSPICF